MTDIAQIRLVTFLSFKNSQNIYQFVHNILPNIITIYLVNAYILFSIIPILLMQKLIQFNWQNSLQIEY